MKKSDKNLEKKIMAKIMKNEVKIKPKFYFVLISLLSVLAVAILSTIGAYSISILALWIRIQNASGPAYGARRNLTSLVDKFPWWAIFISVFSIVVLVFVVKKIGMAYKIKLSYLVSIIVLLALIIGFVLSYSQFPNMIKGNSVPNKGMTHGRQIKMK